MIKRRRRFFSGKYGAHLRDTTQSKYRIPRMTSASTTVTSVAPNQNHPLPLQAGQGLREAGLEGLVVALELCQPLSLLVELRAERKNEAIPKRDDKRWHIRTYVHTPVGRESVADTLLEKDESPSSDAPYKLPAPVGFVSWALDCHALNVISSLIYLILSSPIVSYILLYQRFFL